MAEPFEYNFNDVLRLVRRLLSKDFDHESITQEILFECWRNNCKASYTFIRNRCFDALRRRECEDKFVPQPEGGGDLSHSTSDLYDAIEGLTPEERKVLYYVYWQGQSLKETAQSLRFSVQTTTTLYHEALSKLEAKLRKDPQ